MVGFMEQLNFNKNRCMLLIYNPINAIQMNLVMPCFEKVIEMLFENKQLKKKNEVIKRYSSVDLTPPIQESQATELEQPMPNNYTELTDAQVFIVPDADAETSQQTVPGNMLINKCRGGSFIIMRSFENVYIDTCSNGFAFIGPCHSTIFIRNCQNMRIRAIAQQLRIENSENIIIEGIVGVKPVLQDCKSIKFYSMTCRVYEDLIWQIEKAKIDVFENQIYECYDFTPKKISNFSNAEISSESADDQWEAKIQINDLDWGLKNVYLPQFTSTKKSMIRKVYTESQIKSNSKIIITFTKMHFKEFLGALSCPELCKNFTIIQKLPSEHCLKILKNFPNYKQKIPILDQRPGNWYFLIGRIHSKNNKYGMGLATIEERDLIWKLFNSVKR